MIEKRIVEKTADLAMDVGKLGNGLTDVDKSGVDLKNVDGLSGLLNDPKEQDGALKKLNSVKKLDYFGLNGDQIAEKLKEVNAGQRKLILMDDGPEKVALEKQLKQEFSALRNAPKYRLGEFAVAFDHKELAFKAAQDAAYNKAFAEAMKATDAKLAQYRPKAAERASQLPNPVMTKSQSSRSVSTPKSPLSRSVSTRESPSSRWISTRESPSSRSMTTSKSIRERLMDYLSALWAHVRGKSEK